MRNINLLLILLLISCSSIAQKGKTENVIIITLDGFRWQELYTGADAALIASKEYVGDTAALRRAFWAPTPEERRRILMPFMWGTVAKEGQLYGNRKYNNNVNCTNNMWFSYPGYNEILSGAADDVQITSNDKIDNPNVTVLEYLNGLPAYKGKVAAFGSWDVFPYIINEKRSGVPVNAGYESVSDPELTSSEKLLNEMQATLPKLWGSVRFDALTHQFAMEHLKKKSPRVLFISYGETDDFAHDGEYDHYLHSARNTDKFIGDLWAWTQSQPAYRNKTTLLITTDHGRGTVPLDTWRSHGTKIAGADQIWIAVIGPDTRALGEVKDAGQHYQNQVAPTAAALLGVDFSAPGKKGSVITSAKGGR